MNEYNDHTIGFSLIQKYGMDSKYKRPREMITTRGTRTTHLVE